MRRLITTLAATFAAIAASAGTAIAGTPVPVQSATQSSATDQAALAESSATQVDPTNQNISVRVLSPGNDGAVSQSNEADSSATAAKRTTAPRYAGGGTIDTANPTHVASAVQSVKPLDESRRRQMAIGSAVKRR